MNPIHLFGEKGFPYLTPAQEAANISVINKNIGLQLTAIWICAYAGFMGASLPIGNFFAILLYDLPVEVFKSVFLLAPAQRAVFALIAAIIGLPLLVGLPKIGVFVGPQDQCQDDPVMDEAMDED